MALRTHKLKYSEEKLLEAIAEAKNGLLNTNGVLWQNN